MKKVLWLPSWYPSRIRPLDGDFIQRHAHATALYLHVHVLFVVKDEDGIITNNVEIEKYGTPNYNEVIAYYKPLKTGFGPLDKMLSITKYLQVSRQLVLGYIRQYGLPELVHVHVAMWAGVIALWLKLRYGICYVVTEHWTGYQPQAPDNIHNRPWYFKRLLLLVLRHAALLLPVSRQLAQRLQSVVATPCSIIPNVADTGIFKIAEYNKEIFRFIHVSTMNYQKNTIGILRCFNQLLQQDKNWEAVMIGPADQALLQLSAQLQLDGVVNWKGELTYQQVAEEMQESSALVLFSRFENLPCVIIEAHCCGLPVIATNVGGIPELVTDANGILVPPENEQALLEAMMRMIKNYSGFDSRRIASEAACTFSYPVIGKQIMEMYFHMPKRKLRRGKQFTSSP